VSGATGEVAPEESMERRLPMRKWSAPDDSVNHPAHYTTGNIEVIEYIEDKLSLEGLQGYFVGNIIKYISRYRHKNGVEDLKKARWYLDRMIKNMERENDE
jgi:hypothetical protein